MVIQAAAAAAATKEAPVAKKKRPRPQVEVVACGSAFPRSTKVRSAPPPTDRPEPTATLLDWQDTVQQVRNLGMTGMVGQQKRNHADDQYKQLTGRTRKHHQVPLPIVRGIRKKAAARETRLALEAKEAGIVRASITSTASTTKTDARKRQQNSTNRVHGPAPSIGFVKKGVFRVPKKR